MPKLVRGSRFTVHGIRKIINCHPFGKLRPSALSLRLEEMTLSLSKGQLSTVNWRRRRLGFTLIELLIVFTLLILTSGLIVAALNTFGRSQDLKNAALALKNDIRFTQNKALSGDKTSNSLAPAGCPSTGSPQPILGGWYVELIDESSSYRFSGDCLTGTAEADFSSTTKSLPAQVRISSISYGATNLTEAHTLFRPLASDVSVFGTQTTPDFFDTTAPNGNLRPPIGTGSDLVITLSQQGGETYQVIVKPSGEVNENKP